MASDRRSEFKVELLGSLDFPAWNRECRRLALRGGLLPFWEQQLILHPAPLGAAAIPVAKRDVWQRFRADVEASVKSEPEQHLKTFAPAVLEAMNPAQLFCELRDNGTGGVGFGTASYEQQCAEKLDLDGEKLKFHLQEMKPHGFINMLLERLDRLPHLFPPAPNGSIMHHLMARIPQHFTRGFQQVWDSFDTAVAQPTAQQLGDAVVKRLTRLIQQGLYKQENGTAFVTALEANGPSGTTGAGGDKTGGGVPPNGGDDPPPGNGSSFTKNQLRKIKAAARKEGQQHASATGGHGKGGFKGDKGWDNRNSHAPTEWIASGRSTNWNSGGHKGSAVFQGECNYCGCYGHRENECRKKQPDVRDNMLGRNAKQGWAGGYNDNNSGGNGGGGYQAPWGPAAHKGGFQSRGGKNKGGKGKGKW